MNQWLTFVAATRLAREHLNSSVGRAQAVVREAYASGEVRTRQPKPDPVLLTADDGVVNMSLRPGAVNAGGVNKDGRPRAEDLTLNHDDLVDWLNRTQKVSVQAKASASRPQYKRDLARTAIATLWPDEIPDQKFLSNNHLLMQVGEWLKREKNIAADEIGNNTILRAAGRKA